VPSYSDRVEALGLTFLPAGLELQERQERFAPFAAEVEAVPAEERRVPAFSIRFGRIEAPARIASLREAVEHWEPHLLVHDTADLAAPIAAADAGIACVNHGFGIVPATAVIAAAARETGRLWTELGLVPEALGGAFRGTYVDLAPPSLAGGTAAPARRVEPLRPIPVAPPVDETPPAWLDELPERPTVAVTLGTVWNAPAVFRLLLDALEPLDVNVVATVGRNVDPEALGPHPPNARVERYVSQALLLPRVHAVVSHGGSGSMLATLAHGLPMLLVPLGADQFDNAERCVEAGLARRLLPDQLDVDSARAAVAAMLEDDDARERAGRAAAEIAEMPGPADVANRLAGDLSPV
jgi:hypothetical protein